MIKYKNNSTGSGNVLTALMFASARPSSVRSPISHFSNFCFHHRTNSVIGGNWRQVPPTSQVPHRQMCTTNCHSISQWRCQFIQEVRNSSKPYTRFCKRSYYSVTSANRLQQWNNIDASVTHTHKTFWFSRTLSISYILIHITHVRI